MKATHFHSTVFSWKCLFDWTYWSSNCTMMLKNKWYRFSRKIFRNLCINWRALFIWFVPCTQQIYLMNNYWIKVFKICQPYEKSIIQTETKPVTLFSSVSVSLPLSQGSDAKLETRVSYFGFLAFLPPYTHIYTPTVKSLQLYPQISLISLFWLYSISFCQLGLSSNHPLLDYLNKIISMEKKTTWMGSWTDGWMIESMKK